MQPVVPSVLVNGTLGIDSGWSCVCEVPLSSGELVGNRTTLCLRQGLCRA